MTIWLVLWVIVVVVVISFVGCVVIAIQNAQEDKDRDDEFRYLMQERKKNELHA